MEMTIQQKNLLLSPEGTDQLLTVYLVQGHVLRGSLVSHVSGPEAITYTFRVHNEHGTHLCHVREQAIVAFGVVE